MTIQTAYTLCGEDGKEKEGDEVREERWKNNLKKKLHTQESSKTSIQKDLPLNI